MDPFSIDLIIYVNIVNGVHQNIPKCSRLVSIGGGGSHTSQHIELHDTIISFTVVLSFKMQKLKSAKWHTAHVAAQLIGLLLLLLLLLSSLVFLLSKWLLILYIK